jgi:hypothetical protein
MTRKVSQTNKQEVHVKVHIGDKHKKKRRKRVRRSGSGGGGGNGSASGYAFTPVLLQSGDAPHISRENPLVNMVKELADRVTDLHKPNFATPHVNESAHISPSARIVPDPLETPRNVETARGGNGVTPITGLSPLFASPSGGARSSTAGGVSSSRKNPTKEQMMQDLVRTGQFKISHLRAKKADEIKELWNKHFS